LLGYCLGGTLSYCAAHEGVVDVAVSYYPVGLAERLSQYPKKVTVPLVMHFGDADAHIPIQEIESLSATLAGAPDAKAFVYRDAGRAFATPGRDSYQKSSARLAHSRTIAVLRRVLGPVFDLEAIWDAHLACEFVRRDADATLDTMSSEPYVNHIPTLTGGVGRRDLHYFYARHFIPKTPPDFRMIPISRTVGADRIVDEGVGCFTHTTEFDFLLPGIPPTGRYVEVPSVLVVSFRGGKLQHEHIYWDQASVLVQVGLLDATGLPVTGREQATKALDEGSIPSNELLPTWRK
ncbi:MAG: dienelactone hydrolase family protein, partial [bacterium]